MAPVYNLHILCGIAYEMETQTNIHRSLFQEMRVFPLMLFSLGLSLGLRGMQIC